MLPSFANLIYNELTANPSIEYGENGIRPVTFQHSSNASALEQETLQSEKLVRSGLFIQLKRLVYDK